MAPVSGCLDHPYETGFLILDVIRRYTSIHPGRQTQENYSAATVAYTKSVGLTTSRANRLIEFSDGLVA